MLPSFALGRDGSPSRPFAIGETNLMRFNGGLGEPALPYARSKHPGFSLLVRRNLVFGAGFVTFAPGLGPGGEVACGDVHVGLGHEVLQEVDIV